MSPEGIFALDSCNRLYGVSAADGQRACLGEAKMLDLTFCDKLLYRARYIFSGDIWTNRMLIIEINHVGLERGHDSLLGMLRSAPVYWLLV